MTFFVYFVSKPSFASLSCKNLNSVLLHTESLHDLFESEQQTTDSIGTTIFRVLHLQHAGLRDVLAFSTKAGLLKTKLLEQQQKVHSPDLIKIIMNL